MNPLPMLIYILYNTHNLKIKKQTRKQTAPFVQLVSCFVFVKKKKIDARHELTEFTHIELSHKTQDPVTNLHEAERQEEQVDIGCD